MSLIELMIGIAIVAILFVLAAPSFSQWIQQAQIRTGAEAIQNGLMLARAEAVRRNAAVRFQLTDTMDVGCSLSTTGTNWVVSLDDPSATSPNCASAATADTTGAAPRIIQKHPAAEGSKNTSVAAGQSLIVFNGLGRITPVPAGNIDIDVENTIGGNCVTDAPPGPMHCMRIRLSPGGQVRMCDPSFAATDPQGCPP
jgi:type IV fimbrial biogenesis protein FimT